MANRNHHNVQATDSGVIFVYGSFVGANGANGTSPKGCVVSATRGGEGDWDLVLRDAYPNTSKEGESTVVFADAMVAGTSIGDKANVAAHDMEPEHGPEQRLTERAAGRNQPGLASAGGAHPAL